LLKVASALPFAAILISELRAFSVTTGENGHTRFEGARFARIIGAALSAIRQEPDSVRRSRAAATGRPARGAIRRTILLAKARAAARRRNTFQPDVLTTGLLVTDGSGPDPPVMRAPGGRSTRAGHFLRNRRSEIAADGPYSASGVYKSPAAIQWAGLVAFGKRAGRPAQWGQDRGDT
jgi:hypothetical protein